MPSQDIFQILTTCIAKELHKQTIQDEVIRPLLKWILWKSIPYIAAMVILNFFITVAAISTVLYFHHR